MFQNNTIYQNNYQRASAYFLSTCAPKPELKKRNEAYNFIMSVYNSFYNNAIKLGLKPIDDVYFKPWEQQRGREKDIKNIREPITKIEGIIKELFDLVEDCKFIDGVCHYDKNKSVFSRLFVKVLNDNNITIKDGTVNFTSDCILGMKELAQISRDNIIHITDGPKEDKAYLFFSRCVFKPNSDWLVQAFDKSLKANGLLIQLCNELDKRGYKRVYCKDGKRITLDYVKAHGKKNEPLKMSWADKTHSGIEVTYEELRLAPVFLWTRAPMFRQVLDNIDNLSEMTKQFIYSNIKSCEGCRYCVQTDKTKTRPLACIKVFDEFKCSLYPSFTLNWRELNQDLINGILGLTDEIDGLLR